MDLQLKLNYKERNDNTAILLYDVSMYGEEGNIIEPNGTMLSGTMYQVLEDGGNSTFTGAGSASNDPGSRFVANLDTVLGAGDRCMEVTPLSSEVVAATLQIYYTSIDGLQQGPFDVDLFAEFGPFPGQENMVYTINGSHIGLEADAVLPDGVWDLLYNIEAQGLNQDASNTEVYTPTSLDTDILVYGVVKVGVYDKLRQIPISYMCNNNQTVDDIEEAELAAAYLKGIEASAYVAKREELLRMLGTLSKMLIIGTNIY